MTKIRSYADVETWTIKQLIDATDEYPNGAKKITIPEFQRRLVWDKDKQEKLISSIKSGYPFGSLLLYEDIASGNQSIDAKRFYKLIDGLQRTQALRKYTEQPNAFFTKENISQEFVDILVREFNFDTEKSKDQILRLIEKWVKDLRGFSETQGWGAGNMTRFLVKELLELELETDGFFLAMGRASSNGALQDAIENFLQTTREEADIGEAKIPVIVYTGPTSELATVFELLNSQGTALSRYEIFAAQWIEERRIINNDKIIQCIWQKYQALEEQGLTLDVTEQTPDVRTRKTRKYSLFEYLFGFGQYLTKEWPNLFKSIATDRPSSAGFNLVSACVGLHVKDMDQLPKKIKNYDLSDLESKIFEAVDFVHKTLFPVLSVRYKGRKAPSIYHSEFQIISIIATAFQARYNLWNMGEIDGWKNQWRKLKQNIPMYYLYDVLREDWRGSGDAKLNEDVQNMRYLKTPPGQNTWRQVLGNWFADKQLTLTHTKRYTRDQTPEILFLKYIYAHRFTVMKNAKNYHIEHLIPVDQLTSIMATDEGWPINAVSNLALLEDVDNIRKRDLTFLAHLKKQFDFGKISGEEYDSKLYEMEEQLLCPSEILPEEVTQITFENFLIERFKILCSEFISAWKENIPLD